MSEVLRRLGCDVTYERTPGGGRWRPGRRRRARRTRRPRPTTTWCAGCAPRSACSARWSPAAARARVALPGGDAIGSRGLDMHISGLERLGRHDRQRARLPRRHRPPADRHVDLAGLPVRRRHREPGDGGGPGRRAPRSSTTPRASRRSSTSARCSPRWAPASTGPAPPRSPSRASTRSRRSRYTTVPDRIVAGHLGDRCGHDPRGRRHRAGRRRRTSPSPSTS